MSWFRVDDSFWSHPKVLPLSLAARGVWLTAGTWCATHLTDGEIDAESLHAVIPGGKAQVNRWAAELVDRGLWEVTDRGWRYRDWSDYQPSREKVLAERAAARERQRRAREAAREARERRVTFGEPNAQEAATVTHLSRRDSRVTSGAVTVPPTRPDP